MVDRYLSPKFNLVSIHLTVCEKTMSTGGRRDDGRQTDDGCPRHDSSSAMQ